MSHLITSYTVVQIQKKTENISEYKIDIFVNFVRLWKPRMGCIFSDLIILTNYPINKV